MAVPKKRTSKSRKNMRRSHDHLIYKAAAEPCPSCGEVKLRHHVCGACGTYRGKSVVEVDAD